jgi:hypothetical protein
MIFPMSARHSPTLPTADYINYNGSKKRDTGFLSRGQARIQARGQARAQARVQARVQARA